MCQVVVGVTGASGMESPTRGILKNSGAGDDSYLFCNVPEHHDLVSVCCALSLSTMINNNDDGDTLIQCNNIDRNENLKCAYRARSGFVNVVGFWGLFVGTHMHTRTHACTH